MMKNNAKKRSIPEYVLKLLKIPFRDRKLETKIQQSIKVQLSLFRH